MITTQKKNALLAGATLALPLALMSSAKAQIATYDFTGALGSQASTAATGVDPNLTAADISRGAGVTAAAAGSCITSTGWATGTTLSTANNDYYTITLTPASGFGLNLTSLVFSTQISSQGPANASVRTSLDGFATDAGAFVPTTTNARVSIPLNGPSFTSITAPIEVRIYGYNAVASGGTFRIGSGATPNLLVNGSVAAIPEPTTLALLAFGGAGMMTRLRRKK